MAWAFVCVCAVLLHARSAFAHVAFYYGVEPPAALFDHYTSVVVDPDRVVGSPPGRSGSIAFARVVSNDPRIVEALWARGYRAFMVDDAHVVIATKAKHPDARLLFHGNADAVPPIAKLIEGFVTETTGPAVEAVKTKHGVPVTVIATTPSHDHTTRVSTAKKILAAGFAPWVARAGLDEIGVGAIDIVPRKVLLLYRHDGDGYLGVQDAAVLVAPVLEHLGYVPEYVDVKKGLPAKAIAGEYAGVVVWLPEGAADEAALRRWLLRQIDDGVRVAFMHGLGTSADGTLLARLGLANANETARAPITLATKTSRYVGFEAQPRPRFLDRPPVRAMRPDVTSHLRLTDGEGAAWDGVVIGPWGGAAFPPYVLEEGLGGARRWILDPFAFLEDALALPPIPAPDVTTESGRRILTAHIDGDAFYSRAERRGNPFTASIVLDEILRAYPIPHTVSIVEGEISPAGMVMHPPANAPYPDPTIKTFEQRKQKVETLEKIARAIFALPHVELASHTFSHPFFWEDAEAGKTTPHGNEPVFLPIDGYTFDLEREIKGSIDYIESRLAPAGKKVRVLLWSGSCSPSEAAVALTKKLGVFNVNGGGATRTNDRPSLTLGSAMGIPKGSAYQVFAPIENENVYTNDFLGPYHGYRRVIETFALNESPRRLSTITIYFHFYSAAKAAALAALKEVYAWALAQESTPLYLSEYAAKVLGFQEASLGVRLDDGAWQVRGLGELRTLRLAPALGTPDFVRSKGVAGVRDVPQGRYVTLAKDSEVDLVLDPSTAPSPSPHLDNANGRVLSWQSNGKKIALRIAGHQPLVFSIRGAKACVLRAASGALNGARTPTGALRFALPVTDTKEATLECR